MRDPRRRGSGRTLLPPLIAITTDYRRPARREPLKLRREARRSRPDGDPLGESSSSKRDGTVVILWLSSASATAEKLSANDGDEPTRSHAVPSIRADRLASPRKLAFIRSTLRRVRAVASEIPRRRVKSSQVESSRVESRWRESFERFLVPAKIVRTLSLARI